VLMVLLDDNFDATEIYEADRESVIDALTVPGSKARNERGALGVSRLQPRPRSRRRSSGRFSGSVGACQGCPSALRGLDIRHPLTVHSTCRSAGNV
jgi:hypothetical protein